MDGERLAAISPGEYRTKRDEQSKIVVTSSNSNGPLTFTVYRKDGTIEYYGDGAGQSTTKRLGNIDISGSAVGFSPVTREWLMSRVVDRHGNTMTATYEYPMFSAQGVQVTGPGLPKTLSYTSNPATGRAATKTVTFVYTTDPDLKVTKFESGVPLGGGGHLLTEINITAPRPVVPGLVTKYKLTYAKYAHTRRSLLNRVQRCGADGTCMAPTIFDWSPGAYTFEPLVSQVDDFHPGTANYSSSTLKLEGQTRHLVAGDFDGDGRQDLLYRTFVAPGSVDPTATQSVLRFGGPSGFSGPHPGIPTIFQFEDNGFRDDNILVSPMVVDINGDGLSDVISTYLDHRNTPWPLKRYDMYKRQAGGFTPLPAGILTSQFGDPNVNIQEGTELQFIGTIAIADVNGDGLVDVGRQRPHGPIFHWDSGDLQIRMNANGTLGAYSSVAAGALWQTFLVDNEDHTVQQLINVDVNGDGRTEIVMQRTDLVHSFGVSGSGGFDIVPTNVPYTLPGFPPTLLDLNGDGLKDIMFPNALWLNTGNGFLPIPGPDIPDLKHALVDDLNGDGMDDILAPGCSPSAGAPGATAYISRGDGRFAVEALPIPSGLKIDQACPHVLMDIDGDGQKDYVQPEFGSDNLHVYFRRGQKADRMTSVENGLRSRVSIEYSRYRPTAADACSYPQACGSRNVEIVSGYTVDEGQVVSGQAPTTHYSMHYEGPTADAQGGGWVGFRTVQRTNDRTNATQKKFFVLGARIGSWRPLVGSPTLEEVTFPLSGSGRTMTRQRTVLHKVIRSNPNDEFGPYTVQPESISEVEYESGANFGMRSSQQTFTYDEFGNVRTRETIRQFEGSRERIEFGVTNNAASWIIGMVGSITTTSTSATGETDQRSTTFDIDPSNGDVLGKTIQPGDPLAQLAIAYGRNLDGLVTTVIETPISGAPRVTRTEYDAIEGAWPAAITNALGQVTRVFYHCGLGVLVGAIDPNGVRTQWRYDNLGRQKHSFDDLGTNDVMNYDRPNDSRGLIINWTDVLGRAGTIQTDVLGREIRRTETAFDLARQLTSVVRFYDAISGGVGEIWRPHGANGGSHLDNAKWTFRYDEIGRPVFIGAPGEVSRTVTYDGLKATLFENGVLKGYRIKDELGRVVTSADIEPTSSAPNDEILTTFEYGPFGNPRHIHLPGGGIVDLEYDHLGRRTLLRDPDAGAKVTRYNAFGEIVLEHLPGQEDVIYDRDQLGRAMSLQQGTSTTIYQFDSAANGIGKVDVQQSPSGVTTAFTYRPNGTPESTTWTVENAQFRFDWQYTSGARLTGITYPDIGGPQRFGVSIGYGADGQVGSLYATNGPTFLWAKTAVADDGQAYREEFGGGVASIRTRDPVSGKLTHISTGSGDVVQDADGGATFTNRLQSLGYVYFENGKLQTRTDFVLGSTEGFDYDNIDRLKTWTPSLVGPEPQTGTVVQYGFDDLGNLTNRNESSSAGALNETYRYGENGAGPHALTSGPLGSYTYDASGRQTVRPGQPLVSYNFSNLPNRIQRADGSVVDFAYDADGGRAVKKTATSTVISLGDLYERRTDSNGTTHVLYLPGDGRTVGQISCPGGGSCAAPVFFHPDRYGTIDTVTSNGGVVGKEKRDPFGRPYTIGSSTEPGAAVTIGFTGAGEDSETGLVNLKHRLYDTRIGRFISPDPLVKDPFGGQHYNRYAYASNNPLSFIDPSGLQPMPPPGAADPTGIPPQLGPAGIDIVIIGPTWHRTNGVDWEVNYVTVDRKVPSAAPGPGDPTAPYNALDSTKLLAPEPTFSAPPSPSQDHVNDPAKQGQNGSEPFDDDPGDKVVGVPNVGDVDTWRVRAEVPEWALKEFHDRGGYAGLPVENKLGVGLVAGAWAVFAGWTALPWLGRFVPFLTATIPAASAAGTRIGQALSGQAGGKIAAIAQQVTNLRFPQAQAAAATDAAVQAIGLRTAVIAVGNNIVVSSVQVGNQMRVLVVETGGRVVDTYADISVKGLQFAVSNIRGY